MVDVPDASLSQQTDKAVDRLKREVQLYVAKVKRSIGQVNTELGGIRRALAQLAPGPMVEALASRVADDELAMDSMADAFAADVAHLASVSDANYVVVGAADSDLPNERRVVDSARVFHTAGGPGGTLAFDVVPGSIGTSQIADASVTPAKLSPPPPQTLGPLNADVEITNTVTPTVMYTCTVPAGTVAIGTRLQLELEGDTLQNTLLGRVITLEVLVGGVVRHTIVTASLLGNIARRTLELRCRLHRRTDGSTHVLAHGQISALLAGALDVNDLRNSTFTVDWSVAQDVAVRVTMSTASTLFAVRWRAGRILVN